MKFEFVSRNATRDKGPSPLLKTIYWFNWYNNRIDVAAQLMSTALTQNLLLEKLFIRRIDDTRDKSRVRKQMCSCYRFAQF